MCLYGAIRIVYRCGWFQVHFFRDTLLYVHNIFLAHFLEMYMFRQIIV